MLESKYGDPWVWENTVDEIEVEETGEFESGYRVLDCYGDGVMEATATNLAAPYRGYAERAVACVNAMKDIPDPSACRTAVEGLVKDAEAYRMASQLRIYELENGEDWTYDGDREQDCDEAERKLLASLARVEGGG